MEESTQGPCSAADVSPNKSVLDEADRKAGWFHAKKSRPIWAQQQQSARTVVTLEGEEFVDAGMYLCRGEAGDIWPQSEKNVERRYIATNEVDADGWRMYQPRPDADGVMAIQIDHPFEVQSQFGKLAGKPGDFLVKDFQNRNVAYPDDVWIVAQKLFQQTYAVVPDA